MGCTSSAPNMANSSTAEKSIQFEDENSGDQSKDVEEIIYRAANDTNVLPSCDTLTEPVHIVRNKSTPSLKKEKENTENEQIISESMNKIQSSDSLKQEDKVPRLKEVVDNVFGTHMTEHTDNTQPVEKEKAAGEPAKEEETTDKHSLKDDNDTEETNKDSTEGQTEKKEHSEETLSPSKSELSRATRWEALADIAAELPPSLTVDPTTGQIYSVFK